MGEGPVAIRVPACGFIKSREVIRCEYVPLGSRVPRAVGAEGAWYRGYEV